MRESLIGISRMVLDRPYPGQLPDELKPFHAYMCDGGHSILCIPNSLRENALASNEPLYGYEVPVPVRYVLEQPYTIEAGYVFVDVEYDPILGVVLDWDEYEEW